MEDKIIEMMGENFSMRKILEEDGWKAYVNASDKVKLITEIVVKNDLRKMQEGFYRTNKLLDRLNTKPNGGKK